MSRAIHASSLLPATWHHGTRRSCLLWLTVAGLLLLARASAAGEPDDPLASYDGWYLGFVFKFGYTLPLGDSHHAAPRGEEFRYSLPLTFGLAFDLGTWCELNASVTQEGPALNEELLREVFGVGEVEALSSGMTSADLRASVLPISFGRWRPYLGLGLATVSLTASETTMTSAGCTREDEAGGCADPYFSVHYGARAALLIVGLRFDLPGGWIDRKPLRSDTSILVPLRIELTYRHNFWHELELERHPTAGAGYQVRRTPTGLNLDHLSLQVGFGMMF